MTGNSYTAQEVQSFIAHMDASASWLTPGERDMLTAYATPLEQREAGVTDGDIEYACRILYGERWLRMDEKDSPRRLMRQTLEAVWPQAALAAQGQGEAVAWIDEFGNTYPIGAHSLTGKLSWLDAHKRNWRPLYTHPAPPASPAGVPEGLSLDYYDAGLLGDGGGGDVDWWQNYMRSELDRAHDFYQSQVNTAAPSVPQEVDHE